VEAVDAVVAMKAKTEKATRHARMNGLRAVGKSKARKLSPIRDGG
jgi:hypothetical protein